MENIFETRLLTEEDFLSLDLTTFDKNSKIYTKIVNIQNRIKNQRKKTNRR